MSIVFSLGSSRCYDLRFAFDHSAMLPRRIAVVIGKNGVGKSQVLRKIASSAIAGASSFSDGSGGRPIISRILAFAPTNEAAAVFPRHTARDSRVWYRRHSLNRSAGARAEGGTSDLIIQVARSTRSIAGSTRWEIFLEAISSIRNSEEISLCLRDGEGFVPLGKLNLGSELKLLERFARTDLRRDPVRVVDGRGRQLSSGELSFLKFAAQASLNIENGSLLLLDEPETHLHPNFISGFVSLLNKLLSKTGSAAILATHSVYFVREVFREQVTVLTLDDELGVRVQRPMLRTFGADVGAISYFVFGEDEISDLATEVEKRLLSSNKQWHEIYDEYKDELSLEFLSRIRAKMEAKV
jgi:predicted ATPase